MTAGRTVLVTATNYSSLCTEAKKLFEDNGWNIIENDFGRPMTFDELKERVGDIDGPLLSAVRAGHPASVVKVNVSFHWISLHPPVQDTP